MRVYYITSGLQGCYYYRCFQPMSANGWDGDQTTLNHKQKTPENKARAAQASDVVVFHRPDDPRKLELARMLKQAGKKIVFDNDDTYKDDNGFRVNEYLDKERMERKMASMNETLDAFIKEADLVTCSTDFLNKEYKQLNPNVVTLPNLIDPMMFDEPERNEGEDVRVGFGGSVSCTSDFYIAVDLVRNVPEVQWVMQGLPSDKDNKVYRELYHDEFSILETIDVEWHPFCDFHEYFDLINSLKLDIMIIPRNDTYFNRCKSNIKFLEASMFEIPVIAQGFEDGLSPYQVDKEDAEHMIIAYTVEEFEAAIRDLASNKEKRREMGRKAREYVENKYDINKKDNYELWQKAYQKLFLEQSKPST